ncbi:cation-translocating P-type ATPase [bacterium]|nr:cation-translocating P-type ATPase [bacterium]
MSKDCCLDNHVHEDETEHDVHGHGHSHGESAEKKDGRTRMVLEVNGMHCADCALNIERSIGHIEGVLEANVNYITGTATIYFDPYRVDDYKIKKAIAKPGYLVRETAFEKTTTWLSRYGQWIPTILLALILGFAWISTWQGILSGIIRFGNINDLANILAIVVIVFGGYSIFKNAFLTLLSRNLNVNVLVSAAAIAAMAIGEYLEAATVIFIMVMGEFLEDFTVGRTNRAISQLIKITPQQATVRRNGKETQIPVDQVNQGETIIVKAGERIPIDGDIISGEASINQAVITGESMPIDKGIGDAVYSGTVNDVGYLEVKATKVGADTTLARIKRLIQEAQMEKAPIQRVVDKYAGYFIPIVFLIAIGVFLSVYFVTGEMRLALERAITILIVACPCALVLGTPTAVIAGLGSAAKRGVLIKGGIYLEAAGRLTTALLDKTGTLTLGKPEVTDIDAFSNHSEDEILQLAAIAEKRSEHPLAKAVLSATQKRGIEVADPDEFTVIRGKGVLASYNGNSIVLGKRDFLIEYSVTIPEIVEEKIKARESEGRTVLIFAHDSEVCGLISISDRLRDDASEAIASLHKAGIKKVVMLTGDNQRTGEAMAREAGIDEVYADMLPEDKLEKVKELQSQGQKVAMVGDGINDAPALAAADIGIAMGRGTDVAIETADIALMEDELKKVSVAIRLSRRTLNNIRQNLIFAIAFNFAMVALSATGIISIIAGAILHQVSSLGVILNAMRLLIGKKET